MAEPPPYVDQVDPGTGERWRFWRTEIKSAEQLVNGKAWIQVFEHVLQNLPKPRRTLGVSLSDTGDPRHTMPSFAVKQRNDALKAMREPALTPDLPDGARRGIGAQLRLGSGEEVLVIANVGPQTPKQLPCKFREMPLSDLSIIAVAAKCPHMGACLNHGELKDVEDLASRRQAIVRCPWHNYQFDLTTGEGIGNYAALPSYPVRVLDGVLYVGTRTGLCTAEDMMDVDASQDAALQEAEQVEWPREGAGRAQACVDVGGQQACLDTSVFGQGMAVAEVFVPSGLPGVEAALRRRSRSPRVQLQRQSTIS